MSAPVLCSKTWSARSELNPQPLPPGIVRIVLEAIALNPQPLPPAEGGEVQELDRDMPSIPPAVLRTVLEAIAAEPSTAAAGQHRPSLARSSLGLLSVSRVKPTQSDAFRPKPRDIRSLPGRKASRTVSRPTTERSAAQSAASSLSWRAVPHAPAPGSVDRVCFRRLACRRRGSSSHRERTWWAPRTEIAGMRRTALCSDHRIGNGVRGSSGPPGTGGSRGSAATSRCTVNGGNAGVSAAGSWEMTIPASTVPCGARRLWVP